MTQTLTIPGELTDLNTYIRVNRSNRYAANNIKQTETHLVDMLARKYRGSITTFPVTIHFSWYTKNYRKDPDNIAFAKKFILDGLVLSGVLPADSMKYIKGFIDTFSVDAKKPRIEITITST